MPIHNRFDLNGKTFDGWTVLRKSESLGKHGEVYWDCRCECGKERPVVANSLVLGKSTSCGCRRVIHGHSTGANSKTYNIWVGLRQRCENPNAKDYKRYGARGITVCERWASFENFLSDMGAAPEGRSLDRIDNNGPYSPENCKWATPKEQQRNRSITVKVEVGGREFSVAGLADALGLERRFLAYRLENGWSVKFTLEKD